MRRHKTCAACSVITWFAGGVSRTPWRQTPESDWLFAPHKCEGQSYVTLGSASVNTNVFLARVAPHTCEGQSYVTLVLTSADPKVHPVGHALGAASVGTKVT